MEKYTLTYLGNLRVKSVHERSGSEIFTDAPVDNEGNGEGFSPTDLVCASLGSCMITILGIMARRQNTNIEGLTAHVSKTMSDNPRRIKEIVVDLHFPPNNYSDRDKEIFKRAVKYCPVALSLHEEIIKTVNLNF